MFKCASTKASTMMSSITHRSAFRANSPNCFNAEQLSAFVRLQAGNGTHSANGFFSFSTKAIFLQSRSGICTFEEQFITVQTHNRQTPGKPRQAIKSNHNFMFFKTNLYNCLSEIIRIKYERSGANLE